jgi:hypothetical protein
LLFFKFGKVSLHILDKIKLFFKKSPAFIITPILRFFGILNLLINFSLVNAVYPLSLSLFKNLNPSSTYFISNNDIHLK